MNEDARLHQLTRGMWLNCAHLLLFAGGAFKGLLCQMYLTRLSAACLCFTEACTVEVRGTEMHLHVKLAVRPGRQCGCLWASRCGRR